MEKTNTVEIRDKYHSENEVMVTIVESTPQPPVLKETNMTVKAIKEKIVELRKEMDGLIELLEDNDTKIKEAIMIK